MSPFVVKFASIQMNKVFIIAGAIGFFYYFKVFNDGGELKASIAQLEQDLATETKNKVETEKALAEVERMRKTVGELGSKYQDLIRQLPTDLSSLEINKSIDEFSKDSGVNIVSRKPEEAIANEIFIEELVTLEAEAEYSKLAQFIYFLSRSERLIAIKNFNVKRPPDEKDDTSSILQFKGTVINYRLAPEKPKKSDDELEGDPG